MKPIRSSSYNSNMRRCLYMMVVGSVLMAGCTVGPDFAPLDANVNEKWIDASDETIKEKAPAFEEWWTLFEDPILSGLVEKAYEQNLSLRIAGLRVLEARARRGIAAGLFFPQLQQLSGTAATVNLSDNNPNLALADRNFNDYGVGFDAVWELDFWGKYRRGIESADAALLASVDDYDGVLVGLIGEVAATYFQIRTFERRLALARENVALQARTLEIAEVRFRNGAVTELDVSQARSNHANTQALIPLLEDGLRQSRITLSILLGIPPSDLTGMLPETGQIPNIPAEVVVGIPADLLRRRPDVRSAEQMAAALSAQIGIAEADFYPAINLFGSTGFRTGDSFGTDGSKKDLDDLFESDSYFGFLGLNVSWPIFNYGRIKNNVRVQDARFQQAVVNYENTVLRAAAEVEGSLSGYRHATTQAHHLKDSVAATQRSVDLAMTQYREGTMDFIRVLTAQSFLVAQQDRLAATEARIALNLVSTYKSLGGGWEIRRGQEFIPHATRREMAERTDWGDIMGRGYSLGKDALSSRPNHDARDE
ncbi:MAG: efflux transporter outer membrane subunit [Phycisphaerales bacterium]|nr:MAG: efflux transporter outer membrane subunit [Phycisphaerales bacterium]